jgi:hypothetical protein
VSIDRLKPYIPEEEAKRLLQTPKPISIRAQTPARNVMEHESDDEGIPIENDDDSDYVIDDIIMIKPVIG